MPQFFTNKSLANNVMCGNKCHSGETTFSMPTIQDNDDICSSVMLLFFFFFFFFFFLWVGGGGGGDIPQRIDTAQHSCFIMNQRSLTKIFGVLFICHVTQSNRQCPT